MGCFTIYTFPSKNGVCMLVNRYKQVPPDFPEKSQGRLFSSRKIPRPKQIDLGQSGTNEVSGAATSIVLPNRSKPSIW